VYINDGQNLVADQIAADASNIRSGGNPAYTVSDFLSMYPGFGEDASMQKVMPEAILQIFVDLGLTCIQEARFHGAWQMAIGYFIAHFATLWLEGNADPNGGAAAVLAAGQSRGLVVSESVGDVSVSMDYNTIAQGLEGWASWLTTNHGRNLASLAKLYGKGGMVVR
jgi:hypothetical protein